MQSLPGRSLFGTAAAVQRCAGTSVSFRSRRSVAMAASEPLRIGFIGAGGINFGSPEGPWNHSARLQQLPDVVFTTIVDPNQELAKKRIHDLQQGPHGDKWRQCQAFATYQDMLCSEHSRADAAFIGVPPQFHGGLDKHNDLELQLAQAGLHLFVEKPLSVRPAEEVEELAAKLREVQQQRNLTVAVGYMFRYSSLARAAKRVLERYDAKVLGVVARYACAYSTIEKREWWDREASGGPIVEQATHFVDLCRFFAGEIEQGSVQAVAVGPQAALSDMPQPPKAEAEAHELRRCRVQVPMERRINRVTAAVFRFDSGAVGSLTHSLVLHGAAYDTELEILADGLRLRLIDPYGHPQLLVRHPHSDQYEEEPLDDEDMYLLQAKAFVEACRKHDDSLVASPFEDAARSYLASQWITAASQRGQTAATAV